MKEALLYESLTKAQVICRLCAHNCQISDGKFGFCGIRQNIGGILFTHSYGHLVALQSDPVEKKPLYHFFPGSAAFSIASAGCNFRCGFCQNWGISQINCTLPVSKTASGKKTKELDTIKQQMGELFSAEKVVALAKAHECRSIAYTYTEPTVSWEFVLETAKLAHESGLKNILVTNGYFTAAAFSLLKPYLDAVNLDLKFFQDRSYEKICAAHLTPVLDSLRLLVSAGVWVEVTTLIIPGVNDSLKELAEIAKFIAELNLDIPWHISRFHADYKFNNYPDTPESSLKLAYDLGKKAGLNYIYAGNISGWGQDTYCPACHKVLIKREGFRITEINLLANLCSFCQASLPGFFNPL